MQPHLRQNFGTLSFLVAFKGHGNGKEEKTNTSRFSLSSKNELTIKATKRMLALLASYGVSWMNKFLAHIDYDLLWQYIYKFVHIDILHKVMQNGKNP